MISKEIPVVIGVGDVKNRATGIEDAKEPAQLMVEAIQAAVGDCGVRDLDKLKREIDSIDVVRTWTWPYEDLPGLLADRLGAKPKHKRYTEHGGNQPAKLLDGAARRISRGESRVAVITGGEALASLSAFAAAKELPPPGWTKPSETVDSVFKPTELDLGDNLGAIHGIGAPIHVYPLYENAFRAHRSQTIKENHAESANLYAEFSKIAASHPYAWNYGKPHSAEEIGTVSNKNRMISFPYPLLMNAFNTVNLAACLILTSASYAETLGVPKEKLIYPLGGAGTSDHAHFWHYPAYHYSPAISASLDAGLDVSGCTEADIDIFDFYSCFPIVPKFACWHLDLPITCPGRRRDKPISLLGGLTSFGGAGNNYSMHALTEMVRRLRNGEGRRGLVLANGGLLTYQYAVVLGREARADRGYPAGNPLEGRKVEGGPDLDLGAEGEAVVETYTVDFKRDGSPLRGYIVGRLKSNGKRFLANHGDENTLRQMASGAGEIVGLSGRVRQDSERQGRALFTFDSGSRL
ncbi:hypothetical protein CC78DRAFT_485516 [Lojkania enalia]|uniref:Thiolase-like protein type 1 additional C-terminal domain-containing protein n=1 Tax=Lojkania enalia TaxID=147567 RepID=A0A9P4NCD5_9PLEO|nr:hypothetical protein CC78DRAFT_485516 [Didymosphaeria enalia]